MFDNVATTYDDTFTSTQVGSLLRKMVWNYLDEVLLIDNPLRILELNCGTGEDAIYLAIKNHSVTATDQSHQMVDVANKKIKSQNLQASATAITCDIKNIAKIEHAEKYDLIFSNFGGLNCVNSQDLKKLSVDLKEITKPNARFIAVVMTKFCLWESLYFAFKLQPANIFRRNTNEALPVKIGNVIVNTWYYSPYSWISLFNDNFEKICLRPIGTFLPPSYLDPFFENKQKLLRSLYSLDNLTFQIPGLAYIADHFLIDMKLKNQF